MVQQLLVPWLVTCLSLTATNLVSLLYHNRLANTPLPVYRITAAQT